jgi:type I restriction enzyme R subunit
LRLALTIPYALLNLKQIAFIKFVLRNYVQDGVDELDVGKLSTMLTSKYGGVHAAQQELVTLTTLSVFLLSFNSIYI